ncbi:MAG: 3-dehydroquinate synthase [Candidatus Omnitrophota bacterium]|nr:3-dehydroquinate synthase [Candidatus Omnitrophota bacterium]
MHKIQVHLKERSYNIIVGNGLLKKAAFFLRRLKVGTHAIVITNKRLVKLYGRILKKNLSANGIAVRFEIVPDSEMAKSGVIATRVIKSVNTHAKNKDIFIIAFGGGVVGDLAGFVAALYKRGIPYVQIPTTLLAQVDSAIGGKVAIDLPAAKNILGAFYQPKIVISDTALIKTLSPRQLRSGLSEIIKYGIIKDRALFEFIERSWKKILMLDERALDNVIIESGKIKADICSRDEFDKKGARVVLNYGHTIGHAIESASGYSHRYNHGEALAIGMVIAARISCKLRMLQAKDADRIEALIKDVGLPTRIQGLKVSDICRSYLHDKKFIRGKNRFVLPVAIGKTKVAEGIPDAIIINILKKHLLKQDMIKTKGG